LTGDVFSKDPDAVKDYAFNWDAWLGETETILTHQVTVPTGLTLDSSSIVGRSIVYWLSGGTTGLGYAVTCHITTSQGRQDDRTMYIVCREA
jgi:hypothetical protein